MSKDYIQLNDAILRRQKLRHINLIAQKFASMQVGPLYLAEMAPAKLRGTLNVLFQLFVTIGILVAGLINYGSQYIHPWGWRLPLAIAGGPGLFILLAGILLPESPNSLAERNKYHEAAKVNSWSFLSTLSYPQACCYIQALNGSLETFSSPINCCCINLLWKLKGPPRSPWAYIFLLECFMHFVRYRMIDAVKQIL